MTYDSSAVIRPVAEVREAGVENRDVRLTTKTGPTLAGPSAPRDPGKEYSDFVARSPRAALLRPFRETGRDARPFGRPTRAGPRRRDEPSGAPAGDQRSRAPGGRA